MGDKRVWCGTYAKTTKTDSYRRRIYDYKLAPNPRHGLRCDNPDRRLSLRSDHTVTLLIGHEGPSSIATSQTLEDPTPIWLSSHVTGLRHVCQT